MKAKPNVGYGEVRGLDGKRSWQYEGEFKD